MEGFLGRGFASKCKPSIKLTTERIHAIRRKRNAREKFLKKDLADLLAAGLDVNAFGRAGGLLAEFCFSSCYDFVLQSCECILKHLSAMKKKSECPDDCRVAVASLMYAAARFSDLPELRDLRHIFQEKYGNSLEHYADQEFVEKLASKPPTLEKKVMLLQDIASEFLVRWDSRAFTQRMHKPPASSSNETNESCHNAKFKLANDAREDRCKFPKAKESPLVTDRRDASAKDMHAQAIVRGCDVSKIDKDSQFTGGNMSKHKLPNNRESTFPNKEDCELQNLKEEKMEKRAGRPSSSSHWRTQEGIDSAYKVHDKGRVKTAFKRDGCDISSHREPEIAQSTNEPVKSDGNERKFANLLKEVHEEDGQKMKPPHNISIPPLYHKSRLPKPENADFDRTDSSSNRENVLALRSEPRVESNGNERTNTRLVREVQEEENQRTKLPYNISAPPPYENTRHNTSRNTEFNHNGSPLDPSTHIRNDPGSGCSKQVVDSCEDDTERRSSRRSRRSKLPPSVDSKQNPHRRRRNKPVQDMHTVLEDAGSHHQVDEEEILIDKLLLRYSHKPSSYDPEKLLRKINTDGHQVNPQVFPHPARSVSLPPEETAKLEAPQVITRAASLQQARHVHPKLPDYDDLAARFAAMKAM